MKKRKGSGRRGNPVVSIRLKPKTIRELDRVTRSLGYDDRSAFLREFVEVTVAGDIEGMNAFLAKAMRRAMEQAQLTLAGLHDDPRPKGGRRVKRAT